jgi:hypothetical protein
MSTVDMFRSRAQRPADFRFVLVNNRVPRVKNRVRTMRDENRAIIPSRTADGFGLLRPALPCGSPKEHNEGEDGVMKRANPR